MAAEEKQISTKTIVSIVNSLITIFTYFEEATVDFINFFITSSVTTINAISFDEGELGYVSDNLNFGANINDQGEFIVNDLETSPYWINNLGELIFNPPGGQDDTRYITLIDPSPSIGTGIWRIGVRDHALKYDVTLTSIGFDGDEDIDWKNRKSTP
jgi:hypothetical protein